MWRRSTSSEHRCKNLRRSFLRCRCLHRRHPQHRRRRRRSLSRGLAGVQAWGDRRKRDMAHLGRCRLRGFVTCCVDPYRRAVAMHEAGGNSLWRRASTRTRGAHAVHARCTRWEARTPTTATCLQCAGHAHQDARARRLRRVARRAKAEHGRFALGALHRSGMPDPIGTGSSSPPFSSTSSF